MDTSFRLFPEQASTAAAQVDRLYFFLLAVASFFTLLIFLSIVFFVFKYRRRARADRSQVAGKTFWMLEITWTLIPLGLTMIMFGWGADLFYQFQRPPPDCIEINVLAKQWMWRIQHAEGKQEINALHVPVGRPVKLRMISEDVIHSFFIPSFRVKQDVLPGRYTTLWFEPTKVGRYHLFCAEYCGTSHSRMTGEIVVQSPADYANWLQGGERQSPEEAGRALFEQFRCGTCHGSGNPARCPPLEGVFGRRVQLASGETLVADETYLRDSILKPAEQVVAGYRAVMPTYQGQIGEEGIFQLVAYMKSLQPAPSAEQKAPPEEEKP